MKNNRLSILKELDREELEKLFSEKFCDRCEHVLDSRIHSILNRKRTRKMSSDEQKERLMLAKVGRKTNFVHIEKVDGRNVNVVQGLELHTRVFSDEEQQKIVKSVYELQRLGQKGRLRERTYSEPAKWMRGKGRVTIQFGCCYNYAVDRNGNPPGIIRNEEVDPLPPIFIKMIKRMVKWHVLPPTCVPNSCIVNIYDKGDCIPPHIDHHDFLRPFCTISFLAECNILFGSNLKIVGPGEFSGPVSIPLPVGSVLVLKGNGADVAKHCVPAVPARRISITFRKMDESRIPYGYSLDPELRGLRPLATTPLQQPPSQQKQIETKEPSSRVYTKSSTPSLFSGESDFPPFRRKAMDDKIDEKEEKERFKMELKAMREAAQWRRLQGISMEGDDVLLADMDVKEERRRDEWMTTLPPERKPGVATQQSTKSFNRTTKEGRGDTSAWTDTPSDRAQKAKMNYLEAYNEAAALAAANYEEKKASNADAELVDKYNKAKRSKSLVEKHQESTRVRSKKKSKGDQDKQKQEWEGDHPWKPWDRDKDLTAGRQNVKLDAENMAQGLTSRFSSGSFQRNFL